MEKSISYLNKNFNDFKQSLIEMSKKYYPHLADKFDDASVGSWLIDINADVADNLSYYIDRALQETNITSAQQSSSIYSIARSNGFKVPGPKGSMAEVKFSCEIPVNSAVSNSPSQMRQPNWAYAPILKRGTKVSSGSQIFELLYDVDFSHQFDDDGYSDRTVQPIMDSNGILYKYRVSKRAVVVAGETRIYKQTISNTDITPFMEILLPVKEIMGVDSIVTVDSTTLQGTPSMGQFFMKDETSDKYPTTKRFFEVDSLAQQNRWGEETKEDEPVSYQYGYLTTSGVVPTYSITKGEWKTLRHKFITEYTDQGYLKVIFGAGLEDNENNVSDYAKAGDFARYQMSKMMRNEFLGVLPEAGTTIFIMYRVGGGKASNVAAGAINNVTYLNADINKSATDSIRKEAIAAVKNTLTVTSLSPSVSGKDMPTVDELRYMIKYNSGSQERCVTVKDYISRVLQMPAKYGTPFRVGGTEENNKIMLYLLGIDYLGKLDSSLPSALVGNIQEYLSQYRSINDYVEMKSGRIINLSFEIELFVDKNYNKSDVMTNVISAVSEYMDVNHRNMGDDLFVGDLERIVSGIDGVISIIDFRVYNEFGNGYSSTQVGQKTVSLADCISDDTTKDGYDFDQTSRSLIDLDDSDGIIYSDGDCMLEMKYDSDIRIRIKER